MELDSIPVKRLLRVKANEFKSWEERLLNVWVPAQDFQDRMPFVFEDLSMLGVALWGMLALAVLCAAV